MRNKFTITMISSEDINSNICIYLSSSKFPKNEIRSTDGIIMKKLFTIKFRVINNNSIDISGGRGNNLREVERKERGEEREE